MDAKFRRSLVSVAVAALVSTAALAQSGGPEYSTMTISSDDGTSRGWISDNPIYGSAREDLVGIEVLGSDGGSIGTIKAVVLGSDLQSAHAVIAVVASPGTGAGEILVALDELRLVADRVHVDSTAGAVVARAGFQPEGFSVPDPSGPIIEFSAFEPLSRDGEPGSDPSSLIPVAVGRVDSLAR